MNRKQKLAALGLGLAVVFATPAMAQTELITNGDFETGDLSGWSTVNVDPLGNPSGSSTIEIYSTGDTTNGTWPLPAPTDGSFALYTEMSNPALNIIYQDVAIPANNTAQLSLSLYYANFAVPAIGGDVPVTDVGSCPGGAGTPGFLPADGDVFFQNSATALLPTTSETAGGNQRVRVDVADPAADPAALDAATQLVFETAPGSPAESGPTQLTADLSAFAGQTVRVRIIDSYSYCFLHMAVDGVSLLATENAEPAPPPAPAVPVPADGLLALLTLMLMLFGIGAWTIQRRD